MLGASLGRRGGLILAEEEEEERLLKQNTSTWARIYVWFIYTFQWKLVHFITISKKLMFKISLQKVVANRLQAHIKNNHLSNPLSLQSAYVKHHSTESVLLKVHNDIISMQTQSNSTGWKTLL